MRRASLLLVRSCLAIGLAESHAGENIGTADCHVLQVELKHVKGAAKKTK